MQKIVENEKKELKKLIEERRGINTRILEIEVEMNQINRGIELLKPQLNAAQNIYDALEDETAQKDLKKAESQLADANVRLNSLKVEFAEAEKRLTAIDGKQKGMGDKIQLGKYLMLRQELSILQIESYKKSKDLSGEIKPLVSQLKDNNMVNAGAILIGRLNRGIV
jgi:chromosome segregation ATPase